LLGPADYLLLTAGFLLYVSVLVCAIRSKSFLKYIALNLYVIIAISLSTGRFVILETAGFRSRQYYYFFYYSDVLLTICLYFVLMELYSHVFSELRLGKYIRGGAMLVLGATALVSYLIVAASHEKMGTAFVTELSQNLYFVGLALTYVLWGALMKLHETRTRLIQFVLSMGVYFSAFAASFALSNLYPAIALSEYAQPVLGILLPAAWTYTFSQVSEDARLAVASVASSGSGSSTMSDR
jgi:hypothetical protein